jgi:hypothetical protein
MYSVINYHPFLEIIKDIFSSFCCSLLQEILLYSICSNVLGMVRKFLEIDNYNVKIGPQMAAVAILGMCELPGCGAVTCKDEQGSYMHAAARQPMRVENL